MSYHYVHQSSVSCVIITTPVIVVVDDVMLGKSIAGAMHRTESNVLYRGRSHHRGGKLLKYSSKPNKEVIPDKFPAVAIYNRLKLIFLEPASYAFIFKIFCFAWSRRPREYFCSDQMHLAKLGHSSHVDMGGFKIWPTKVPLPFSPSKLALFTKVGPKNPRNLREFPKCPTNHDTFSPAKSEFHLWQKIGHKFPAFPSIEASACLRTSLPVPGFGGRSRWVVILGDGHLPPIWAMKMSSTPNSLNFIVNYEQALGVTYVQTNPLLPEEKHKKHQIWETFWSQKTRKNGWI